MNIDDIILALRDCDSLIRLAERYNNTGLDYLVKAADAVIQNPILAEHYTVRLFNNALMRVSLREEVGRILFLYKAYEPALSHFIMQTLKEGQTFFDVGAHFGYFSLLAAQIVGPAGLVHAFEPSQETQLHLAANVSPYPQIAIQPFAVGDFEGFALFNDFGPNFSAFNSFFGARLSAEHTPPAVKSKVRVTTLDAFCLETGTEPDLIKVDVESFEMQVLKGMSHLLSTSRPILALEVGDFEHLMQQNVASSADVLRHIRSFDYQLFEPTVSGVIPHKEVQNRYDYANIICKPAEKSRLGNLL